jgi:hypothetical protein
MKEEFKQTELAATAEEIRDAVAAKSVTPSMVGGTLLALVNATGEVVDTLGGIKREHVKVRVRGHDGEGAADTAGAMVKVQAFSIGGFPTVELPILEFDIPWGFKYAVTSFVDGMGASFQKVYDACLENREIVLWNFPVGVFYLGHTDVWINVEDDGYGRAYPFITKEYLDWDERFDSIALWDLNSDTENLEDNWYVGVLISTAETSFAIGDNSLSDDTMRWCDNSDYGKLFPLMTYDKISGEVEDYESARTRAMNDFDGAVNTAKLIASSPSHIAAKWCLETESYSDETRYLPSAGQLYLMWQNRTAINDVMQSLNDNEGINIPLLPYQNAKNQWVNPNGHYEYWWSSSVYNEPCSWVVHYYGYVLYYYSYDNYYVRAVSAFHFEY